MLKLKFQIKISLCLPFRKYLFYVMVAILERVLGIKVMTGKLILIPMKILQNILPPKNVHVLTNNARRM